MFETYGKLKITVIDDVIPRVLISDTALLKMNYIVKHSQKEVGWLCSVDVKDNVYTLTDVYLFPQTVTDVTVNVSAEDLAKFAENLLTQPNGYEIYSSLKCWGHSHVNMEVIPSGTDDTQMDTFDEGNAYFIRVIANKRGNLRVDLFDYDNGIVYECIQWEKASNVDKQIEQDIIKQLDKCVTVANNMYLNHKPKGPDHVRYAELQKKSKKESKLLEKVYQDITGAPRKTYLNGVEQMEGWDD